MAFLTTSQLAEIGFHAVGQNVLISDKASIYGAARISLGSHVRIDDFCILSAGEQGIQLGSYIHVACYSSLIGKARISLGDFSNLSSRVAVYSSSDDYSGNFMTNPMVPEAFTNVDHRPVAIHKHCIIGSGTIILPGVTLEEGCAVGALSLVIKSCPAFGVYAGIPAKGIGNRSKKLLEVETLFQAQHCSTIR